MDNNDSRCRLALLIEKYWFAKKLKMGKNPLEQSTFLDKTENKLVLHNSNENKTSKILKLFGKTDLDLTDQNNKMDRLLKSFDDSEKRNYEYMENTKQLILLLIGKNNDDYTKYAHNSLRLLNSYVPSIECDPNMAEDMPRMRSNSFKESSRTKEPTSVKDPETATIVMNTTTFKIDQSSGAVTISVQMPAAKQPDITLGNASTSSTSTSTAPNIASVNGLANAILNARTAMDTSPTIMDALPTASTADIAPIIEKEKEKVFIDKQINCLKDLIQLCDEYPEDANIEYNINMGSIRKIRPHLEELQALVGMNSLKENIVDQILYYVQDFHNLKKDAGCPNDYMHTVIYGPPGTGKTEVAKIMGKIFANLGVLKSGVFKKVTREDLIAGYLGQTATKTKDVIKSCKGGVLFIDEAYALGNSDKKDSFSKESIDTICEALSDMRGELMCIIAGYETELKTCFFSYNEGLESRFTWRFKIDDYNSSEMNDIFNKKVGDLGWKLNESSNSDWFEKNMDYFKYFGRDMETLLSKTKIAHSRRVFCLPVEEKGILTMKDLENGMVMFMKNDDVVKRLEDKNLQKHIYQSMYS